MSQLAMSLSTSSGERLINEQKITRQLHGKAIQKEAGSTEEEATLKWGLEVDSKEDGTGKEVT